MKKFFGKYVVGALVLLALIGGVLTQVAITTPAKAASVTPVFVPGNPSCVSLGYSFGFKVDPPNSGTYSIDGIHTVTVTTDGVNFDWSSTLGMDAVISKGGPNANVYVYDPPAESFGDTGLHSPINASNGNPYGLSHIEFCFDYELTVTKTASTSYTSTCVWTIDKSVTPTSWELFTGDSGTSQYTIALTKSCTDSNFAVSGTIAVANNTPLPATVTGVTDTVSGGINASVSCGVTYPYALAAGATLNCTYSAVLPDKSSRTNTASATTSGSVGGDSGTAAVTFGAPSTVVNGTVNVQDTNGSSWQFSASGSVTYTKTFTCDADEGTHNNTATIVETGQSDSASVTVNCNALTVTKNAVTDFNRDYTWNINKTADQTSLTLAPGQLFQVNYTVTVSSTFSDNGHGVTGSISVLNGTTIPAKLTGVSDIVSPSITAAVSCGVTFPYTLAAGATLNCTYSAALPDNASRTNTATSTLQNYSYSPTLVATPSGTTGFSETAAVTFGTTPGTVVDECVTVSDTNVGVLGTVCAPTTSQTFNYSLWFGTASTADVVLVCGNNTHTNTASFVTNDTGTTGSDTHTVTSTVNCNNVCTLTQGYWKTHSSYGPAPEDDDWFNLGDADGDGVSEGPDETFFSSGMTFYQILWTPPSGGNAYLLLAHQYIAAKLNILNGATPTSQVSASITYAEGFFPGKTPSTSLSRSVRNTAIGHAATLDSFNNGLIGPGHCSE